MHVVWIGRNGIVRGEQMEGLQWKIDGRRFCNQEEYMAAKRDKVLIDSIMMNLKLERPKDVEKIYLELKQGKYQFESIVGRQFDDNIYELYTKMKEEEKVKKEQKSSKNQPKKNPTRLKTERTQKSLGKLEDFDSNMKEEILKYLQKKEKRRRLTIVTCMIVCMISFGYLVIYYQEAKSSANDFTELAALKENTDTLRNNSYYDNPSVVIRKTEKTKQEEKEILDEYKTLFNKNKKLIGWIKIEDTVIDYPVMQTVNNDYYLDHNFNQEKDKNGCIFMDYQCDVIEGSDNVILYGHHMQSGKMFGSLHKYSSEEYYQEHPKIQFDTIYEKGTYEIMYVFRSKVYSEENVTFKYYQFINANSEKEFNSYMNDMKALSLYDTQVTANYGDKLLTLSTCDYQEKEGRFVVVAKRVNE